MKQIKAQVVTKKGNQFEVYLPAKTIVCPECDGSGTELMGGLKGVAISEERMLDDDFREAYFGGRYDVQCSHCKGRNVVDVVDVDSLTSKMRERYDKYIDEKNQMEAEIAAERRFFARAYGD